jgi:hypothetical protein
MLDLVSRRCGYCGGEFLPPSNNTTALPQCLEKSLDLVKMVLSLISNLVEDKNGRAY